MDFMDLERQRGITIQVKTVVCRRDEIDVITICILSLRPAVSKRTFQNVLK
jgi:translation elongation factor EF-4